jgi:hypothetical protein
MFIILLLFCIALVVLAILPLLDSIGFIDVIESNSYKIRLACQVKYYKYFGKRCECGKPYFGDRFCNNPRHSEDAKANRRSNKLNKLDL